MIYGTKHSSQAYHQRNEKCCLIHMQDGKLKHWLLSRTYVISLAILLRKYLTPCTQEKLALKLHSPTFSQSKRSLSSQTSSALNLYRLQITDRLRSKQLILASVFNLTLSEKQSEILSPLVNLKQDPSRSDTP
jgi:hypothetical protein